MGRFMLALSFALPAAAADAPPPKAGAPQDEALMDDFRLKAAYDAVAALQPRMDALARELAAFRDAHAGKTEPRPGGARRDEARAELKALAREFHKARNAFRDLGTSQRMQQVVVMAMQFKEGASEKANRTLQGGFRQSQLVGEYKEYQHSVEVALDEEERAYQEAVGRWRAVEAARRRRRRAAQGAAAAVVLAPAAWLAWRRLRSPALPGPEAADGERLGRWRLTKSPKPWTYGTRWDGADGGAGTTASVRLFDARLCAPPASATALLAALRAAAPPEHPGMASPTEVFPAGASAALVYPATPAKPLSLWLEEGRGVAPGKAVLFLRRLAPALDAAHRAGRAHGGLAPDCVLVGGDGTVLLEDFGVAAALAALGMPAAGLPAYAAPELSSGPPGPAADLYSLGILLYELVTGRHPFEGTNLPVMKQEKRYAPLSRLVPGCPPALDALLDGLLEPDPARRRPAPGGLEAALRAL